MYGDYTKLIAWNQQLETHNEVQQQINQYGSVNRVIKNFVVYVKQHPKDAKARNLLNKINRSQNRAKSAN